MVHPEKNLDIGEQRSRVILIIDETPNVPKSVIVNIEAVTHVQRIELESGNKAFEDWGFEETFNRGERKRKHLHTLVQ